VAQPEQDGGGGAGQQAARLSGETTETCFNVDPDRVVHETIDDETILIQLETGTYYSLTGAGAEIWELLSQGLPLGAVASTLRARYPDETPRALAELDRLVQQLTKERLLQPASLRRAASGPTVLEPASNPFEPPVLHRYTDMEYFLRLDPIHEIDPTIGWPEPPVSGAVS
jgi:hypothetical protein